MLLHNPDAGEHALPSRPAIARDSVPRRHDRRGREGGAEHKTRSHAIEARLRVPDGGARRPRDAGRAQRGLVVVPRPGGVPVYRLRIFDAEEITLRGTTALAPGEHVLRYEFTTTGAGPVPGGTGRLLVDGTEAARGEVTRTATFFSIDETFDIGLDTGSSPADYRAPYPFTGGIGRLRSNCCKRRGARAATPAFDPSAQTRKRILDTAERLFGERGVAAVSLRDINRSAGISQGVLHYHFGGRDALIEAILQRWLPGVNAEAARCTTRSCGGPDAQRTRRGRDPVPAAGPAGHCSTARGRRFLRCLARLGRKRTPSGRSPRGRR
ncbi:MAG: helix-turn-helix transcriptional regulator [Gammaproteobacteria bacterium]|nr:helix-turn-helix transcriptional regulator [Gammaproteobacteria bacterium]